MSKWLDGLFILIASLLPPAGSSGDILLMQMPESLAVSPGETITINCKAITYSGNYIHWYQQNKGNLLHSLSLAQTPIPWGSQTSSAAVNQTATTLSQSDGLKQMMLEMTIVSKPAAYLSRHDAGQNKNLAALPRLHFLFFNQLLAGDRVAGSLSAS